MPRFFLTTAIDYVNNRPHLGTAYEKIAAIAAGKTVIEAAAESGIGWRRAYVWCAEDRAFRLALLQYIHYS